MIGQHIYSRCLEGYFSKSSLNADSTTVTISINMFARPEQAKLVADECSKISVLEDVRPVPEEMQGAYRGVLKIKRMNRQITVICRSYRLHADGSGESRVFTYGSSYILTGEDKQRFLESPEYVLNIQDFESYPSVMQRIQESRQRGNGGRIEANPAYSLFNSKCLEFSTDIFQKAGFTKKLFAEYISSIIQRVSLSHYSGHKKDKVLVILPEAYNQVWEKSGGNIYAEEILAATMKLLPKCVEEQLNVTTGGMKDPDAPVLDGYQLVFMEPCNTKSWRQSEYSIIDLNRQESWVSKDLDTSYGEFLWNYLDNPEVRNQFEKEYESLFNEGNNSEQDQALKKFSFLLDLYCQEENGFADIRKRKGLLLELVKYNEENWSERSTHVAAEILKLEIQEPQYDNALEEAILKLVKQEMCPEELKPFIVTILLQNILNGNANDESILWICQEIQTDLVMSKLEDVNRYVQSEKNIAWYTRKSLLKLYMEICKNPQSGAEEGIKSDILSILTVWHRQLFVKRDWQNCVMILKILAAQLENPGLREESRKEIYEDLLDVLFLGEEESEKQISDILKQEERSFDVYPRNLKLFRSCFGRKILEDDIVIGEDAIWQLVYLAVSGDEIYLQEYWRPLHKKLVIRYGRVYRNEIFDEIQECFQGWIRSVRNQKRLPLICSALAVTELNNLEYGYPDYCPSIGELRPVMVFLERNERYQTAASLLYKRYTVLKEPDQRADFFRNELNKEEKWQILLWNEFSDNKDELLNKEMEGMANARKEFLNVARKMKLSDKEQLRKTADIYLELCESYLRKNNKNPDAVDSWYQICRSEIQEIQDISQNMIFNAYIIRGFRQKMAAAEWETARNLNMDDLLFLKKAKILPLGEGWEFLDVISTLYEADPHYHSEEFLQIRNKIICERNADIKKVYLSALTEKREMLLREYIREEVTYNVALLEEQIKQELKREERSILDSVTAAVWGIRTEKEKVITAFQLMEVLLCYGNQRDYGVYDCDYVKGSLLREILEIAQRKVEVFEDKQLVNEYRKLNRENKLLLAQTGIIQCLRELPKEWQQDYSIQKEKKKSGGLVTGIFSVIFLLAGIAAELLVFVFYDHMALKLVMLIGGLLCAVGIAGAIVVLICMLISLNR